MTILPISLTIAGAAALINVWLGARVGRVRRARQILIGDGGDAALAARMRAQSNFTEYAPLFLILLALVELASESPVWLWGVGALFIAGRILHAFGMDRPTANPLRTGGMALTLVTLIGLALYAIAIPYIERATRPTITYASADLPFAASTASATNGFVRRS